MSVFLQTRKKNVIFAVTLSRNKTHYMDIQKVIKAHGLTQASLARRMGINRVTLNRQLCNNPTVGYLQRLADAIGCKVVDFFTDEDAGQPERAELNGKVMEIDGVRYRLTKVEDDEPENSGNEKERQSSRSENSKKSQSPDSQCVQKC